MSIKIKLTINPKPREFTFIEVCAGAGGLSTGLIKSGFVPLLLNDNNADCCQTLKNNHPATRIVCGSMSDLDLTEYTGKVDLLTGGVPCQSFSQAGSRKGLNDPRGDLILKFADLLDQVRPRIFMIENVKGLKTHNKGQTLMTVINNLNRSGLYNVKYEILNANDYGVPQKRERIIIVGVLKTCGVEYVYPTRDTRAHVLRDVLVDVPQSNEVHYPEEKRRLFDLIPQGGCWIDLPVDLQKSYMGKSYFSGGGKRGILHRLSMDKPSLTIMCTPTQKQTERCHPLESRPLTIRECARIQTFEDGYQFYGTVSSQYKQVGNAVPVELAKRLGDTLRNTLTQVKL
jgi:DNA (cytosine-5)-methyltransferase 1